MPVNCTQCGAKLEQGARFCVNCGAPVQQYAGGQKQNKSREVPAAREKSDRGLNIALLICGILAVAVLAVLLIMLLRPDKPAASSTPAPGPVQVVPSAQPTESPVQINPSSQPAVITPGPTSNPAVSSLPTAAPTATATPAATTAPVAIITPTPRPASPTPAPGGASATSVPLPSPSPSTDYLLPDSNSRYLSDADLSGLTHEQLCFARNEIYARHGRIFKTPQISAYFNSKSWYHGTISPSSFNEGVFNQYEKANIALIQNYEKKYYGGSYY